MDVAALLLFLWTCVITHYNKLVPFFYWKDKLHVAADLLPVCSFLFCWFVLFQTATRVNLCDLGPAG